MRWLFHFGEFSVSKHPLIEARQRCRGFSWLGLPCNWAFGFIDWLNLTESQDVFVGKASLEPTHLPRDEAQASAEVWASVVLLGGTAGVAVAAIVNAARGITLAHITLSLP